MTLLEPGRGTARLGQRLADHGDRLALVDDSGRQLSYVDLAARVEHVRQQLGDAPRLVHVALGSTIDAVVAYLGALAGGHPVIVTGDETDRAAAIIERFDPDALLVATDGAVDVVARRAGTRHPLHPDLAVLLSTSGSTGSPRLVRLSHANVLANATAIAEYLDLTDDDRAITSLPLHYCYGLSVLHSHLVRGAATVLTERSVVDRCFWDAMRTHEVTTLAGVPYTFELLGRIGFDGLSIPSLRRVTQAGGRLAPEHVARLARQGQRDGWDLFVMYGQTEATARMAYLPPHLALAHPGAIGVPIPGGALRIDPCEGAADGEGELVYRGPNVMLGYADDPDDLALGATLDELRTGDLARRNDAGLYEIVGRCARFAKVCGLRIDLDRVEDELRAAGVAALCASDDERLAVAVAAGDAELVSSLVQSVASLPPSKVAVVACDELPRLPNGKPNHQQVLALAAVTEPVEPAGDDPVRVVYQRILGVATVADDDTFVSLGGDSLSYVEASIELESLIGTLPPDWPTRPVHSLRGDRPSSRISHVETSVALRALSIVMIVSMHIKLTPFLGGAHLLLAMAGYSFGRFQAGVEGRLRSIARIAVPSALWLAMATQLNDRIRWEHVVLLNGWLGESDAHGGYWFGEALVQILLAITAVLAIPAVRRLERARPLLVAGTALGIGLLVRFHIVDLPTVEPHDIRPHDILWIFAVGWAAAHARSRAVVTALSIVVLAALPGYFGEPQREVFLGVTLLFLLWVPTLPVPRALTRPIGLVAGASLYIYLSHWQVFPLVRPALGKPAALVACLLAGIALWKLVVLAEAWVRRLRTSAAPRAVDARGPAPAASWLG